MTNNESLGNEIAEIAGGIALGDGNEMEVRSPSGALLPAVPVLAPDTGAIEWLGDWWTATDSLAAPLPTGDGDRVDYDWVISTLTDDRPVV